MSWRDERTTIRRGTLALLVVSGGLTVALLAFCLALLLTALFTEPPTLLVVALVALFALRLLLSLFETARFYVRLAARRRRRRR